MPQNMRLPDNSVIMTIKFQTPEDLDRYLLDEEQALLTSKLMMKAASLNGELKVKMNK